MITYLFIRRDAHIYSKFKQLALVQGLGRICLVVVSFSRNSVRNRIVYFQKQYEKETSLDDFDDRMTRETETHFGDLKKSWAWISFFPIVLLLLSWLEMCPIIFLSLELSLICIMWDAFGLGPTSSLEYKFVLSIIMWEQFKAFWKNIVPPISVSFMLRRLKPDISALNLQLFPSIIFLFYFCNFRD